MAGSQQVSWVELLVLLVHGPDPEPTVRGAIRTSPDPDTWFAAGWTSYGPPPVLAGARQNASEDTMPAPIHVWRDGSKIRIEEPGGASNLIVGETTCWCFDSEHEAPVESPASAVHFGGNGTELLVRRDASEYAGNDFTRPTGPVKATTFLDRRAWSVELAPPPHKPHPIQLVVDAETGLVLQQRNDALGTVTEWVEFAVGETFDPALFTWDGPVRSSDVQRAEWDAREAADMERRREWFTRNVTATPVSIELLVDVQVHVYDEHTGAFEGSFGHGFGSLARRPRSDAPWDLHWREIQHRWSTPEWDWAMTLFEAELTPAGLQALKEQLEASPT